MKARDQWLGFSRKSVDAPTNLGMVIVSSEMTDADEGARRASMVYSWSGRHVASIFYVLFEFLDAELHIHSLTHTHTHMRSSVACDAAFRAAESPPTRTGGSSVPLVETRHAVSHSNTNLLFLLTSSFYAANFNSNFHVHAVSACSKSLASPSYASWLEQWLNSIIRDVVSTSHSSVCIEVFYMSVAHVSILCVHKP